ncbi:MAG TPA: sulfatase-like hydrolase/transferase [Terriglobia bacterium]|nr:sulfatase-like hydrolase/transferase [Terriglobia bacterium]
MNSYKTRLSQVQNNSHSPASRFFLVSTIVGLLVGIFEAALLWTVPRGYVLLGPYVGVPYVIWFLVPLVDMAFYALLGLGLGWASRRTRRQQALVALLASVTATFVALMLHWYHRQMSLTAFSLRGHIFVPLACLAFTFLASLAALRLVGNRVGGFFGYWMDALAKPAAWGLLAVAVAAAVGVGTFIVRTSYPATPANVAPPPPATSPNIILITLDTVRADHLSSYGYSRETTPHLDQFAQQGVLFENAIAPASWTLASHASIFTGLLPHQQGADWTVPLGPGPHTLAEVLRSRGYETAGFTANTYCEKVWGLGRGFETYNDNNDSLRQNLAQTFVGEAMVQPLYQDLCRYDVFYRRDARQLNGSIFRWFRRRTKRPYFLFINYFDAHDPYLSWGSYNHRFGRISTSLVRSVHLEADRRKASERLSASEQASVVSAYDNCLAYLDDQVGHLLETLRQSPGWQNTIVIITSDHGEEFGEHGYYGHGYDLYREVLHVPLIIAGPGVPQGVRIEHLVGIRELFSTVLDMAGRDKTPFSRYSLARFWNPDFKPQPFDDAVVSEVDHFAIAEKGDAMISLTTPQWQYIDDSARRPQLYRWTTDPREQNDLASSPDEQATIKKLHARLVGLVQNSVGPWRGAEYLVPLGRRGTFLHNILFSRPAEPGAPASDLRIGASQAYFGPEHSWKPPRPTPAQRDLIQSLPYQ